MTPYNTIRPFAFAAVIATGIATVGTPAAQEFSLNYERLSSLEEPLAAEIGAVTLVLNGVLDSSLTYDAEDDDSGVAGFVGNAQVAALVQLPNRWRVGLSYFGQYAASDIFDADGEDDYTDNAGLSVGSVWGTPMVGNVSGVVREQTRRLRGAGNAVLAFDDFLGGLGERSAGYVGRFGPWVVASVVDEEGNVDLGAMSQRPRGTMDCRLTLRANTGNYAAAGNSRLFDTAAVGAVGELIYGSTLFDAGIGHERFTWEGSDAGRWYVSAGVRTKVGALSLSLEGHFGQVEDSDEVSVAFGAQYDVARGLSANLGVNHAMAEAVAEGTRLVDTEETRTALSLRYSF